MRKFLPGLMCLVVGLGFVGALVCKWQTGAWPHPDHVVWYLSGDECSQYVRPLEEWRKCHDASPDTTPIEQTRPHSVGEWRPEIEGDRHPLLDPEQWWG